MSELGDTRSIHRKRSSQNCLHNGTGNLLCPSRELNPLIREAFRRIREDRAVRSNLPEGQRLDIAVGAHRGGLASLAKGWRAGLRGPWEVETRSLSEDE